MRGALKAFRQLLIGAIFSKESLRATRSLGVAKLEVIS